MRGSTSGWWSWEPRALILHPPLILSISSFCVPTCQEIRLNKMVNKRSPNSGRQNFYVLSTLLLRTNLTAPKADACPMLTQTGVGGFLEPEHSEKQTNKQLSWNNPDCLVKPACCVCSVTSVMSDSFWPYGLKATRLLCPWDSSGKNARVGCQALLQGIFPT